MPVPERQGHGRAAAVAALLGGLAALITALVAVAGLLPQAGRTGATGSGTNGQVPTARVDSPAAARGDAAVPGGSGRSNGSDEGQEGPGPAPAPEPAPTPEPPPPVVPDLCVSGFVWRESVPDDHVCVTPDERGTVADENGSASDRVSATDRTYGPDTCVVGYVWRVATPADHVCVTPDRRDVVAQDNGSAAGRVQQ